MMITPKPEFTLLYDGDCPICQKEVAWLKWKNKQGHLGFQDIQAEAFDADHYGKTHDILMAEIHGVYPDGRIIQGIDVFLAAYQAVGLGMWVAPLRWPLTRPLFKMLYAGFARHRLTLGRLFSRSRCDSGQCHR
jgi:predicted DCC family thiol-disulfide oxidoreductase YuxK